MKRKFDDVAMCVVNVDQIALSGLSGIKETGLFGAKFKDEEKRSFC